MFVATATVYAVSNTYKLDVNYSAHKTGSAKYNSTGINMTVKPVSMETSDYSLDFNAVLYRDDLLFDNKLSTIPVSISGLNNTIVTGWSGVGSFDKHYVQETATGNNTGVINMTLSSK